MFIQNIVNTYNRIEAWSDDNPLKSDFALGLFMFVVFTPVFYIEGSTVSFSLSVGAILSILFVVLSSLFRRLAH
jgi:hypothetical protein